MGSTHKLKPIGQKLSLFWLYNFFFFNMNFNATLNLLIMCQIINKLLDQFISEYFDISYIFYIYGFDGYLRLIKSQSQVKIRSFAQAQGPSRVRNRKKTLPHYFLLSEIKKSKRTKFYKTNSCNWWSERLLTCQSAFCLKALKEKHCLSWIILHED